MSVHWGFYCRDCEAESRRWFTDPRKLRDVFQKAGQTFQDVWCDRPLDLPTTEIEPLFFLAQHYEHELWVQCELAQLKLTQIAPSDEAADETASGKIDLPPAGRGLDESGIYQTPPG